MTVKLRHYLQSKNICIDGLCGASFGQSAGNFSDVEFGFDTQPLKLYAQEQYGRFGNNIHQVVHSLIIARHLSIKELYYNFFLNNTQLTTIQIDDMILHFGVSNVPRPPQLSHTMFELQGFEAVIKEFNYDLVKSDAEKLGKHFVTKRNIDLQVRQKKIAAFYFRSGDIFSTEINPIYAQPPLSYYIMCYEDIRINMSDFELFLVYENDSNPCISKFKKFLEARGVPYVNQSASFHDDAELVASANCIVAAFSSFCDVLALMNENLDRWYSFRSIAAYEGIERSIAREFAGILRSDNVKVFRVVDVERKYTNMGEWKNTKEQHELMINYPISSLSIEQEGLSSTAMRVA